MRPTTPLSLLSLPTKGQDFVGLFLLNSNGRDDYSSHNQKNSSAVGERDREKKNKTTTFSAMTCYYRSIALVTSNDPAP